MKENENNLELVATVYYAGKVVDVPGFSSLNIVKPGYNTDQAYIIILSTTVKSKTKGIGIILNDTKASDHADLEKFLKSTRVNYGSEITSENVMAMIGTTARVLATDCSDKSTLVPLAIGYVGTDTCFILGEETIAPKTFKLAKTILF